MSNIDYVDTHQAKIKSITMEAPEGYEFGNIVKAEVEMRVAKLEYETDKEGNLIRTAVLAVEGCHIKEHMDPAQAFAQSQGGGGGITDDADDSDDDDDDGVPKAANGQAVDEATGEVPGSDGPAGPDEGDDGDYEREPVGAGVGNVDPEVGF